MNFHLAFYSIDFAEKVARITNNPVDLFTISFKYLKFIDIFNKARVKTLASHHFYNFANQTEK